MAKYRICGGLAIMPDRDMNMLKEMSNKGWHVTGMSMSGLRYRFESGEPHDYDYALNFERVVNAEMISFYEAGGWKPIIALNGGIQIFRAETGTAPIFSDVDSELEVLRESRRRYGKGAFVFLALLVIALIVGSLLALSAPIFYGVFCVLWLCFICAFLPFVGHSVTIAKKKR